MIPIAAIIAALFLVIIAVKVRLAAQRRLRKVEDFQKACDRYFELANDLNRKAGGLPADIERVVIGGAHILGSWPQINRFARAMAVMDPSDGGKGARYRALEQLPIDQREIMFRMTSSLLDAAMAVRPDLATAILKKVYATASNRPNSRFGATEAQISVKAIMKSQPDLIAA